MRRLFLSAAACALACAAAVPATSLANPAVTDATANGNLFTGGLSFAPADLTVPVGGIVRWKNTDFIAPHTVTEVHGLWNLTGGWGATPINPAGFGPGTVAERRFEAGTQHFYCEVHPTQMRGSVAVPVDVSSETATTGAGRHRRALATVTMVWAVEPPQPGLAFDVQRRTGAGDWVPFATATTATSATFRSRTRRTWEVRARLRRVADATAATDWSPPASVTT